MKRYKVMMFAVLGIIALLLSFAPMPATTTAPTGVVEAEAGSNMSVGTEVVLGNNTVATYLGKTSAGNDKWQATVGAPKYLDDLVTPIVARWEYDAVKAEWNTRANLFTATAKGSKVTVWYNNTKLSWQPDVFIGAKKLKAGTEQLLINDPINEYYYGNTLKWDYGDGITRSVRIIEGMLQEYYTIPSLPADDVIIISHSEKDAGFIWTRPAVAWDNTTPLHKIIDLTVDGDDLTLTLEAMQNATLPITIDPDTTFTTSSSDGCLEFYPANSYSVARKATTATAIHDSISFCFIIGQSYTAKGYYIGRSFVYFNTASLPEGIDITSATLKLGGGGDSSDQDFYIQIQSGMPDYPHDRMTETDYNKNYYSGNGGQLVTTDFVVGSYNEIVLTSEGRSWINTTGWTKFCLRSSRDIYPLNEPDYYEYELVAVYPYEAGRGYWPELEVTYETPPSPLERYAPVLFFHYAEDYYVNPIDSMLNESNLSILKNNGTRELVLPGPVSESQLPGPTSAGVYYLDMWNATGAPFGQPWTAEKPDPDRFTGYPYTVYGRQVEVDNYIVLQYWFFYPYNNWYNCHEGDMERIQIICDKATGDPQRVTFGQHWGGETVPWNIFKILLTAETHPLVFVARGSHASYPSNVALFLDETSWFGRVSYPDYVNSSEITAPPSNDKEPYALADISNEPSWVKWSGIWGYYVPGSTGGGGESGPPSPAYLEVNGINVWDDPIEWADDPGSPWNILTVTGSVRLHAYDSNGNHTGLNETGGIETEIPGTYFYVPASNQSEAELMWIYTEENLTFTIEASEVGECNFSFARCSGGEITTNYTHVEVTENTIAKLDTGEGNPLLLMGLDFDSDGVTDAYKFPDSDNTLEGHVTFMGRGTAPNDRWIEPFNVTLFEPGNLTNVLWTGVATTNNTGVFTIDNIPSNTTYDIGIKNWTCLSELVTNVTVGVNETTVVDFGTTREGDASGDDYIDGSDFGILSYAWLSYPGQPNWDVRADFNRDNYIDGSDFGVLSYNWLQWGDLYGV